MIEEANIDEIEQILEVINTSNREHYKGIISKKYFKDPVITLDKLLDEFAETTYYVYKLASKIVGVASLMIKKEEGVIFKLYTLPDYQNRGLGTALMNHMEQIGKKMKLKTMKLLAIWSNNEKVIGFYEKLGYRVVEKIDREWATDCIMVKDIGKEANHPLE